MLGQFIHQWFFWNGCVFVEFIEKAD